MDSGYSLHLGRTPQVYVYVCVYVYVYVYTCVCYTFYGNLTPCHTDSSTRNFWLVKPEVRTEGVGCGHRAFCAPDLEFNEWAFNPHVCGGSIILTHGIYVIVQFRGLHADVCHP